MRLGSRKTFAGLVVLGLVVLGVVVYFGTRRYDVDLELLDRRERCIAIDQSATPDGATEADKARLDQCRREGWTPLPRP